MPSRPRNSHDAAPKVVCSFGPEWIWLAVGMVVLGLLIHYQIGFANEAMMPLPVFTWIVAPTWVGWMLVLLAGFFATLFSVTTTATVDPSAGTVSTVSRIFFAVPAHRSQRPIREVAAVRCLHEGLKSSLGLRSFPILFKAVMVAILFGILSWFICPPLVLLLGFAIGMAAEAMLDWRVPTARLVFMDGREWTLTRDADHEVYRTARRVAKLAEVRVIADNVPYFFSDEPSSYDSSTGAA